MPPRKKFSPRCLIYALILAVAAFFAWRLFFQAAPERPDMAGMAPPVRVATAISQTVPHYLNGLGTVQPSGDVLVKSRVDGELVKLHFQDGQRVKAGDLLAEIDPRPFQAALGQAMGTLERDKAQLDNARRDLGRYAKLAKGDYIAEQQYENQRSLVRQYEGTVEADQAAVDSARLQLEYSSIRAPISGRLGLRAAEEGNQIKASDANGIVRITEITPCDVIFTIPENQVGLVTAALAEREIEPGLPPLRVEAWDREQKKLLDVGELISIDNQIDTATGTIRLKARFPNTKLQLFPNQFVNARLLARTIPDAVTVPAAAVQLGAKGSYVYALAPGESGNPEVEVAYYREVSPGILAGGAQVIDEGLKPGERVVVDGVDRLRDGMPAKIAATMETPRLAETVSDPADQPSNASEAPPAPPAQPADAPA